MKKLLGMALSVVVGLGALVAPAQAQDLQDIIQRGKIVVGVDMTTPPWGYLNENQQPDGYGVALAEVLAESLDLELVIEQVTGPTRIPSLLAGRTDVIISTLTVTAPRAAQVWYSNPYSANPLVLIAPEDSPYNSFEDLVEGVRIAVPRGSPQDQISTENAPNATIMRFDDDAGPLQALVSGQADLLGAGGLVPPVLNEMDPGKNYVNKIILSSPYMAMAVAPGNQSLLQYLNTFLFLQKQNGKLSEISMEFLEFPAENIPSF